MHDNDIPLICKTKKLRIGSGNVIGKSVIQEFFTCVGVIPTIGGSIHMKTNSYADAIVMLVIELERKFMHVHPALQRLFLELPNIRDPNAKKLATIVLINEFDFIIEEAREIFNYYGINRECPPIEEVLYDQDAIRKLKSNDYEAFDENARKKIPPSILVKRLFEYTNDRFELNDRDLGYELEKKLFKHINRNLYDDEITIEYEEPYDNDPPPPKVDFINVLPARYSPFNYLCLPSRQLAAERREYEKSLKDDKT